MLWENHKVSTKFKYFSIQQQNHLNFYLINYRNGSSCEIKKLLKTDEIEKLGEKYNDYGKTGMIIESKKLRQNDNIRENMKRVKRSYIYIKERKAKLRVEKTTKRQVNV